jgi:uncharacterized protein
MELLLAFAAVLVGAMVQGSVGFGLALVVMPVLALVRPEALPAVVLLLTMPMAALWPHGSGAANFAGLLSLLGGRILGTLGGVALLTLIPSGFLSVLFGALVFAAVPASLLRLKVSLNIRTKFASGVTSGVIGTAGGVGGPPLALVYQNRSGPEIRSTLAVAFRVGTGLSLIALFLSGRVGAEHALLTLQLLPGTLLGLFSTCWIAPLLDISVLAPRRRYLP